MIAYRLGELPDLERDKEREYLPAGPRMTYAQAEGIRLPDGTLFCDASEEQVLHWFACLCKQMGISNRFLTDTLVGLDLTDWDYRWWALNEVMEIGNIRDLVMGEHDDDDSSESQWQQDTLLRAELNALVMPYGLRIVFARKQDGSVQVFAQRTKSPRVKVYLAALAVLEEGKLTRDSIVKKLEAKLGKR